MNVLIFISSLIMVLSVITWSRLNTFFQDQKEAVEWVWLMKESERSLYNREEWLGKTRKLTAPPSTPPPDAPTQPPQTPQTPPKQAPAAQNPPATPPPEKKQQTPPGSGQISLAWLLDKSFRENPQNNASQALELAEKVIRNNWGDQPFFKRLESSRPQFVKELLQQIIELSDGVVPDKLTKKPKSLEDLLYLNWKDYELKVAFGRMLQPGLVFKKSLPSNGSQDLPLYSPSGFQSLQDYFGDKKNAKIRIWLAPKAVLLSLYQDPSTVEAIIKWRNETYLEVKKAPKADEAATLYSGRFEEAFGDKTPYKDLVDYKVTTTDPRGR